MTDQVRPIGDGVLVRQDRPQEKVGREGLIFAPQGSETWPNIGTVVAVGPGKFNDQGEREPMDEGLVPGARVMFQRKPSSALEPDAREGNRPEWKDLLMLTEADIIGILEEETPKLTLSEAERIYKESLGY